MNTNRLDAGTITQPGGMYRGINDALLQSLMAYFQHQDRERQGARDLANDQRQNNRQQRNDALSLAQNLGVRPSPQDAGWLNPGDTAAIDAALAERQRKLQMESEDRARVSKQADLRTALEKVQLKAEQDKAFYDSPAIRSVRGVADWVGDVSRDAIKAGLRPQSSVKEPDWVTHRSGLQTRALGNGFAAVRDPKSGQVYAIDPTGRRMDMSEYSALAGGNGGGSAPRTLTRQDLLRALPPSSRTPPRPNDRLTPAAATPGSPPVPEGPGDSAWTMRRSGQDGIHSVGDLLGGVMDAWQPSRIDNADPRTLGIEPAGGALSVIRRADDPKRIATALSDHAGIDDSGTFGPLIPAITGSDPTLRANALRQMPAMWRLRAIDALRRAGVEE